MGKTLNDITEADLWNALYESIPTALAADEKTISIVATERGVMWKTAKGLIDHWVKDGKLESVGLRSVPGTGKVAEAWRPTK